MTSYKIRQYLNPLSPNPYRTTKFAYPSPMLRHDSLNISHSLQKKEVWLI